MNQSKWEKCRWEKGKKNQWGNQSDCAQIRILSLKPEIAKTRASGSNMGSEDWKSGSNGDEEKRMRKAKMVFALCRIIMRRPFPSPNSESECDRPIRPHAQEFPYRFEGATGRESWGPEALVKAKVSKRRVIDFVERMCSQGSLRVYDERGLKVQICAIERNSPRYDI